MDVKVTQAIRSERDVVGRLLELNAYEFSRIDGQSIGQDGVYGYRHLDAYWLEPGTGLRTGWALRPTIRLSALTVSVARWDRWRCREGTIPVSE